MSAAVPSAARVAAGDFGFFDFQPGLRWSRLVWRAELLTHDAFEADGASRIDLCGRRSVCVASQEKENARNLRFLHGATEKAVG